MTFEDFPRWGGVGGGGGEKLGIKLNSAQLQLGLGLSLATVISNAISDHNLYNVLKVK